MAQEREAFGFYFSNHPVDRYRQIARARGARSYGELCDPTVTSADRTSAVMAALVESVRWRDTKRGARYVAVMLSDQSGQFQSSCFEDDGCKLLEKLANDGGCALLTVELDRPSGEEIPRITIRGVQAFSNIASDARMRMTVTLTRADAAIRIAELIDQSRGGRGEVNLIVPGDAGSLVRIRVGRDFRLDMELGEAIEALPGVSQVSLEQLELTRLALVASR